MAGSNKANTTTVGEVLQAYQDYSKISGQLTRNASYSAIAVIWAMKGKNLITIEEDILFFFFLTILIDLLTYLIPSYIWMFYHRNIESSKEKLESFSLPRWINWPYNILSSLRYIFFGLGAWKLVSYLLAR